MGTPVSISGPEAADRLQIRELVDAYAHCADRRDAKGQMSLFTKDTHFVVFMDARSEKPSMELNRREDLAPVFDELNKYEATSKAKHCSLRWSSCNRRNLLHCPSCVCIWGETDSFYCFSSLF
jgi:hypothetical protein